MQNDVIIFVVLGTLGIVVIVLRSRARAGPTVMVCPCCDRRGTITGELIGQEVKCPECGSSFVAQASFLNTQPADSWVGRHWYLLFSVVLSLLLYSRAVCRRHKANPMDKSSQSSESK